MQFIEKWKTPRNLELENDGKIQENLNWKMMDNANDTIGHLFAPFQNLVEDTSAETCSREM